MNGRKAKGLRRVNQGTTRSRKHRLVPSPYRWTGGMAASLVTGLLSATTASALPEGGVVVSGAGTVSQQSPSNMVIRQGSDKLILNWQGFSIGKSEGVRFEQPGTTSVSLNRVVGPGPSEIFGLLTANGRVFLTNPNGVLFGPSSHVEVGSLLATTLGIKDSDFLAGNYQLTQSLMHPLASVVNQGEIVAAPGGFVSFVGPEVMNRGTITARLGTIALGAAEGAILDLRGDGLINLVLTDPVRSGLTGGVTNQGTLKADGGYVTLSAKVASDILHSVVNNEGVIEAKSLVSQGGVVRLTGEQDGIVMNAGAIDVSAAEAGAQPGAVTLAGTFVGNAGSIRALGLDQTPGGHVEVTSTGKTILFSNSLIDVSGVGNSNAGSVRIWSDRETVFAPNSSLIARGGEQGGDGGLIEVSSGDRVQIGGFVNTSAPKGRTGSFLLDPSTITITDAANGAGEFDPTFAPAGQGNPIAAGDPNTTGGNNTISRGYLESLGATTNISLEATGQITVNDMAGNLINLSTGAGNSVTLRSTTSGGISFADANDEIRTAGGSITLQAQGTGSLSNIGNLTSAGGGISLESSSTGSVVGNISAGGGAVNVAGAGDLTISGIISGAGTTFTKIGVGTVTLSGANTYTGGTTLTAGTLRVEGGAALAGTGDLALNGGVLQLAADADTVFGNNVTVGGPVTIQSDRLTNGAGVTQTLGALSIGANTLTIEPGSNVTSGTAGLTFGATTLTGGATIVPAAGTLLTLGSVDGTGGGGQALTINGAGTVTLGGDVGIGVVLGPLAITTAGINLNSANIITQDGQVDFTGPVTLGAPVVVIDTTNGGPGGANINFNGPTSTVNATTPGVEGLTLIAGTGAVTLGGAVGGSVPLASTDFTGASISLPSVTTTGSQLYTGATTLNGNLTSLTSPGTITVNGPATLATDVTVQTAADNITFTNTIDGDGFGPWALTLNAGAGAVTLGGSVGGTDALASTDFTGASISLPSVTTTGSQLYTGATTLNGDLASSAGSITVAGPATLATDVTVQTTAGGGGDITFTNTLDSDANVLGPWNLTLAAGLGNVDLQGVVGPVNGLLDLRVTSAATARFGADVTTLGVQDITATTIQTNGLHTAGGAIAFTGNLELQNDTTLDTSLAGANITVTGATDSDALGPWALTLNAGAGAVTLGGSVGGTDALASTDFTGASISLPSVTTTGSQLYTGATTLNGDLASSAGSITVAGPATLATDVTVQTTAGGGGDITFTNTLDSDANVLGPWNLTLAAGLGNVDLQGVVGPVNGLLDLRVTSAATARFGADVTTLGVQDITATTIQTNGLHTAGGAIAFTGNLELQNDTTLDTSLAGANITVTGATDSDANVLGPWNLTLAAGLGNVDLQGAVGPVNHLLDLTVTSAATARFGANVTTDGVQDITATTIQTNGLHTAGGAITFTGNVELQSPTRLDTSPNDSTITVTGTINSAPGTNNDLTLIAGGGDIGLQGAIGNTLGDEPFNLGITSAHDVTFGNTVTLLGDLTQLAGTGTTTVTGTTSVGGLLNMTANAFDVQAPLSVTGSVDLTANGGLGTITLGADISTLDSPITLTGNVELSTAVQLSTDATTGATIHITGYTDGNLVPGPYDLTLAAGTAGDVLLDGPVGTTNANLNTLAITSAHDVTFGSTVDLAGDLTQTAGTGTTTVTGATTVGGLMDMTTNAFDVQAALTAPGGVALTTNGGLGTITLGADISTTDTPITLTGNVELSGTVQLLTDATTGATIHITGYTDGNLVPGPYDLTLAAGTAGDVLLDGPVGTTNNNLGTLLITSAHDVTFGSTVTLLGDLTQLAGTGTTTVTGATSVGGLLNMTANAFDVQAPLSVTGSVDLTANGGLGTITLGADISTLDSPITLTGNVELNAPVVTLATDAGLGATITVTGTINSAPGTNNDLTLIAGGGDIGLQGAIGNTLGAEPFNLGITSAHDVTFGNTVTLLGDLTQLAGTGTTTVTGTTSVGGLLNMTANAFDVQAPLSVTGSVDLTANGGLGTITLGADISTLDSPITLTGNVELSTAVQLSTDATTGATIHITGYTDGNLVPGPYDLTLAAGTAGDVLLDGPVGTTNANLNTLAITSAHDVTFGSTVDLAGDLTQLAGTGTTTFGGAVNTNGATGVAITTSGPININAAVNTGSAPVSLSAGGAITEGGGGSGLISTTGLLTTSAVGGQNLSNANTVSSFTATNTTSGDIAFTNTANPLTITGISESGGGSVTVSNTGALSTSGAITTAANGDISLTASGTETLGAAITAGGSGTVGLTATGGTSDILINANVGSTAGALTVTAGRNVTLNAGSLATGANVSLTGTAGTVSEAGVGAINGALLTTSSVGGTLLSNTNTVSSLNSTNTGSGNISFVNTAPTLTITGISQSGGGDVGVGNAGVLTTTGTIIAAANGNIFLNATGANITIGGAVTAGGSGTVNLDGTGVTNSSTITGPGGVLVFAGTGTLDNTAGALTNGGGATAISLKADDMALTGGTTTGGSGAVSITSTTPGRPISMGAGLTGLGLSSAELQTIITSGTLTIGDVAHTGTLSTDGVVTGVTNPSGPWVFQTSGGALTLNNDVTTPNNLTLSATGGGATTGAVTGTGQLTVGAGGANSLTVNAGAGIDLQNPSNLAAAVTLTNSTSGNIAFKDNRNMTLAATNNTPGGTLTVVNGTGTLATSGAVSTTGPGAADILLQTAGDLTTGHAVTAGGTGTVRLVSGGAINQTGGAITASSLGMQAAGTITVNQATNDVATVAAKSSAAGTITYQDANAVDIGSVTGSGAFTATSGITSTNSDILVQTGGNLSLSQNVASGTGTVHLVSGGAINQTAGAISGSLLTTNSASGTTLNQAGNTLTSFNATNTISGNIALTNTANPLTITGISNTGGGSDTVTNVGALSITGTIAAAGGGAVNLTATGAAGAITESGGGLVNTSGTLTTSSVTGQTLNGANTVGSFNATNTTSGNIAFTNTANPLTITGITQTGGDVTVSNSGTLTTTGAITDAGAGNISLAATGAGSSIALNAPVSSGTGNLTLTADTNFSQAAGANLTTGGGGAIAVTATNGTLTMAEGAEIRTVSGDITLTSGGTMIISNTSLLSTTGNMLLTSTGSGIQMGVATTGGTVTLNAATDITNSNGAATDVTASDLTAHAGGSITLDSAVSSATLSGPGTAPTTGGITLNNSGAGGLNLDYVNAGGTLNVTNSTGVVVLGETQSGGATTITNNGGTIRDDNSFSPALTAGGGATLTTTGTVGLANDPLAVQISGGLLLLSIGGKDGVISGSLTGITANDTRLINDPPGDIQFDGRSESVSRAQQANAGAAISSVSANAAGQGVFEAVESQIIETVGDPSEQIEEELRLEEGTSTGDIQDQEELRKKRLQQ